MVVVGGKDDIYNFEDDRYYMDCGKERRLIYGEGKFAEILPDKKKKPETKEEFEQMMADYISSDLTRSNFLNQYEL
jgi:hypothetical protein